MKSTLIQHATLINEGVAQVADLRIRGAYIEAIAPVLTPLENEDCIDATGCYLLPGLIDDQVHFREPGLTHKACIQSESQAAIAGGITSFIEMPNTQPQTTTLEAYQDKLDRAQKTSAANYSFMFGGTNDNVEVLKQLDKNKVAGIIPRCCVKFFPAPTWSSLHIARMNKPYAKTFKPILTPTAKRYPSKNTR